LLISAAVLTTSVRTVTPAEVTAELNQAVNTSKLWDIFIILYDIAAGHLTANSEAIEAGLKKANQLQYSCLLPEKSMFFF
jgi:hypothetical protein